MNTRKRVYIASPYTQGDVAVNVKAQMDCADTLIRMGYAPHVPVLSHFLHMNCPHDYEVWMELDLIWIAQCDCLLRLPGHSPGADREVAHAAELGIPVYYSIQELDISLQTQIMTGG